MSDSLTANVLGSAWAGIVGRIFTHPLDTAKARVQAVYDNRNSLQSVIKHPYRGPMDALGRTFRSEGIAGLYRGFGVIIIGGTPGTVVYLCSYEYAKKCLSRAWESQMNSPIEESGHDFLVHFSSGMIAETLACTIYVPVDVIKERLQVQHSSTSSRMEPGQYEGSWDAFKQISRTEGLSGIYRGYLATLGSFGPYSALYFVFYERFKLWTRQHLVRRQSEYDGYHSSIPLRELEIPFPWVVLCSASAGVLAAWLTSPLDMAKLRLQVQRGNLATAGKGQQATTTAYRGVVDCLSHTYRTQGGLPALFRGAGARVIHFTPSITITMTCYESCRSFFSTVL